MMTNTETALASLDAATLEAIHFAACEAIAINHGPIVCGVEVARLESLAEMAETILARREGR